VGVVKNGFRRAGDHLRIVCRELRDASCAMLAAMSAAPGSSQPSLLAFIAQDIKRRRPSTGCQASRPNLSLVLGTW
jgi:hypothetical protein